jgi:hypothetical protein
LSELPSEWGAVSRKSLALDTAKHRRVQAAKPTIVPGTFLGRSARSYKWRGVIRHFRPGDLSANQHRYEQRCSKQAASDHSEKTKVRMVVCHFPLLHDNSRCLKRFPRSSRAAPADHDGSRSLSSPSKIEVAARLDGYTGPDPIKTARIPSARRRGNLTLTVPKAV